ncbi:MAG: FxLYD domain-containing protein [Acholeplasmatales bacterium]|nr:FxLYD domain-containing protein [Acholeplasmatales bacterium]
MKKFKLILGAILFASTCALASCKFDLDGEETEVKTSEQIKTTTSKDTPASTSTSTKTSTSTSTSTKTSTSTSTSIKTSTSTKKKEMKYEVGTPQTYMWTDSIGYKWMKVAIPVTNTGDYDIYLKSSSYDVETKSGSLLATEDYVSGYPQYVKPGETGYYYDEAERDFTETDINIVPDLDIIKGTNEVVRYEISDVSITTDELWGVKVLGRVKNNTSEKGTMVVISAFLFDSNDKLITQLSKTLLDDLAAGARTSFEMSPLAYRSFTATDVARYEIYAYPYEYEFSW